METLPRIQARTQITSLRNHLRNNYDQNFLRLGDRGPPIPHLRLFFPLELLLETGTSLSLEDDIPTCFDVDAQSPP